MTKIFSYPLKTLPFFSVLLLMMSGCSLRLGGYPLMPALFLIPVYYWLVFRPDLLPLWSLFGIGIVYDTLMGSELGVSSLFLILSALAVYFIRPFLNPQNFFLIWGSFGCCSLCYMILYGVVSSGGIPLLWSWIYGVILYPLIAWVLSHLHLRLQAYV